jgi:subtilisin family serine protease
MKNNEHIDFIKSYSSLFNSNINKKYNNNNDIIIEHERLLSNILKNETLLTKQLPYVLNLNENCGSICHDKLSLYLTNITPLSSLLLSKRSHSSYSFVTKNERYNIINIDKALILTSLDNISKMIEKYPYYIRGYTPLLSINKIDIDTYDYSRCGQKLNEQNITFSIIVVIAPLDIQDLNLFIKKIKRFQNQSTILFEFEYDGVEPNIKSNSLISFFDCEPIDDILHSLSEFNEIIWIEPAPELNLFNRWTRSICQTATVDNTPLYNSAELTGLDVIIGIADTGLDMTHCQFYDPNYPTPINTINSKHRKVVSYYYTTSGSTKTDHVDLGFDGHGTHVSG